MPKSPTALALLLCLAGCGGGGGGGGGSGIDPRLARLDVYEAQKLRVLGDPGAGVPGMPETGAADVPATGALIYEGSATLRVEVAADPLVLFGDAEITVDFDAANATGTLTRFFGSSGGGSVVDYDGVIDVQSASASQNLSFGYSGVLAGPMDVLTLSGTMQGTFLGANAEALTAADLEADVMQNGTTRSATLVVITESRGLPPPPAP